MAVMAEIYRDYILMNVFFVDEEEIGIENESKNVEHNY